jgi:probable HAF family extracellular repeat protein
MTDLGVLGSYDYSAAYGINNVGQVVGCSAVEWGMRENPRAFLWTSATGMRDLNSMISDSAHANWTLQSAQAISSNGYIAGYGTVTGGATHAFLLTPALPGDANADHKVDINDLTIVLTSYNQTGMSWGTGDFNSDGKVDINDLTIVLTNYNQSAGSSAAGLGAVPEPAGLTLAALGAFGLLAYVWRKRK